MRICFIGGGNMASALIGGLLKTGIDPGELELVDPSDEARQTMLSEFGIRGVCQPGSSSVDCDLMVLAVKPQVMPMVLDSIAPLLDSCASEVPLVLSVAAGITTGTIRTVLGQHQPVIRAMPNTPALYGVGISGLFAPSGCNQDHRQLSEQVMKSAGEAIWVEEEQLLDVVTAVSGSGPAYFYLLTEALRDAGQKLGLDADTARKLAVHTAHGAGVMALNTENDIADLRRRVTSPGGTTQAAIECLQKGDFEQLVASAVEAATRRGGELAATDEKA